VELLDSITKKLTTPVHASQDGPHNQVNSSTAIEAEVMASATKEAEEQGPNEQQNHN
jgi:hypothetical protein